jgi:exopolysaccharide biosynthesis polyprenyl glycosylphosphotransferase
VATSPAPPPPDPADSADQEPLGDPGSTTEDIRAGRPYLVSRASLMALARRLASAGALVALDLCGLAAGLYSALALREWWIGHDPPQWQAIWETEKDWLPFLALVTVLVFWRAGLYGRREVRAGFGRVLSSLTLVALLALAFAVGTGFEFRTYGVLPATLLFASILIGLLRASYEWTTSLVLRKAGVRRRVLLLGHGEGLDHLYPAIGSARAGIEYEPVGTLGAESGSGLRSLGELRDLERVLAEHRIDELLVADSDFGERELLEVVETAHKRGVHVRVAPRTTELLAERAEYIPGQGLPLFELRPPVLAGTDWVLKRLFDLIVSLLIVLVGLPLWLAIALAIKLTSRGPVLYRDLRVGLGEREFEMLKFRTMDAGAAEQRGSLAQANEVGGALFKIRDDPRVTSVGRFLRRLSLDEIPQVLNVLRGEMSLVGPRPLPTRDYERLEQWHRKRSLVLPGMTGLWQISGRSELGFDDLVNLDFYYLERWSIWLDVTILLKTIPAVLSRRGAY